MGNFYIAKGSLHELRSRVVARAATGGFRLRQGGNSLLYSFVLAAKPPKRKKETSIPALPEANPA
jgi:hypothetical protein